MHYERALELTTALLNGASPLCYPGSALQMSHSRPFPILSAPVLKLALIQFFQEKHSLTAQAIAVRKESCAVLCVGVGWGSNSKLCLKTLVQAPCLEHFPHHFPPSHNYDNGNALTVTL